MAATTLLSTLLMGVFLLAIAVAITRVRHWRAAPSVPGGTDVLARTARNPTTWTVVFVAVTLGIALFAVALVGGGPVSISLEGSFVETLPVVMAPFLVLLAVLLFGGLYAAVRARDLSSATGVGIGALFLGLVFVLVVALQLFIA